MLSSLDKNIHICFMRLNGILKICNGCINGRVAGRQSDFYFHQSIFKGLSIAIDRVIQIGVDAFECKALQNEIRSTFMNLKRDGHDDFYYVQIKDVLNNINNCISEIEKYLANQEELDKFIETCDDRMTEEDVRVASGTLEKLTSRYSNNLLNKAKYLEAAIKSVIPPSSIHKVLSNNEHAALPPSQDLSIETPDEKSIDLNVKILIAYQSGILTGDFHKLPIEKQYTILSLLFDKSKTNIKNALTALQRNANSDKNPLKLTKIVEKANDIIIREELGLPLIKNGKE